LVAIIPQIINRLYLAQSDDSNAQMTESLLQLSQRTSQDHQKTMSDEFNRLLTINKEEKKRKLDLEAKIAELEAQVEQQKSLKAIKEEVQEQQIIVETIPEVLEIKQEPVEESDEDSEPKVNPAPKPRRGRSKK
jgi:Fe-S cluster assembly scaffold protein SufB